MAPLEQQAALITGGGSGIGLACATALLRDGASVTIAGRTEARLAAAVAELEAIAPAGAKVASVVCDVAKEEDVQAAVEAAASLTGSLQLCVASAGTGSFGPIVTTSAEAWQSVLDINLTGAFFTLKHAAPRMVAAGGGAFVGISSIAAPLTHRWMSAYCVSKAGLEALIKNAADELGVSGVRCNAVRPGLVPTELASALENDPSIKADYLAQMPISRLGTTEDIAAAVRFLCGPESSWITGETMDVNGGHTLRRGPDLDHMARAFFGDDVAEGRV